MNDMFVDMARQVGMGRTFRVIMPLGMQLIVISNPANVEWVLKTNFDNYIKGQEMQSRLHGGGQRTQQSAPDAG
jgi:hypothetical protein